MAACARGAAGAAPAEGLERAHAAAALEAQGYLSHRLQGKAYLYQAAAPARSLAARAVRNIIERFCAGSVEQIERLPEKSGVKNDRSLSNRAGSVDAGDRGGRRGD